MAQLVLENMEFYAYHGHYAEEQTIGGRFSVTLVLETDITRVAETDNLEDALDYSRVYGVVKAQMGQTSKLLEHLAARIAEALYREFGNLTRVTVTVSKLNPPVGGKMDKFTVMLTR